MKKVVTWGPAKIASAKLKPGQYRSFKEMFAKAGERDREQQEAQEYLEKAYPIMSALLEVKLREKQPLVVMRPLRYQTSELPGEEEDDGFYQVRKSEGAKKFVDVIKTITPGTQLILKGVDIGLEEFIFEDARGKEYCMHFDEKNNLMTQTDIFETVKEYLSKQER